MSTLKDDQETKGDLGITDVMGVRVGCAEDWNGLTGCTVVLVPDGAVAGVDVRGSAPGTRETDLMRPGNLVERVHAIVLSGGSAFGLDAASGVMAYLEEQGIGFDTGSGRVPIVGGAVIFDLDVGDARCRPDKEMGYRACLSASGGQVTPGNAGAGLGATVGKAYGRAFVMKGGLGTACLEIKAGPGRDDNIRVGALAVVNAFGDIVDPQDGRILAGAYDPATRQFLDCSRAMRFLGSGVSGGSPGFPGAVSSTTLVVVATDAGLTKEQANKVAQMAHDGIARAIRPVHTMYDGDVAFALSTGNKPANITAVGAVAAEAVSRAIVRAVTTASSLAGIPGARDLLHDDGR
ncbi:MAG TPA: P1 family peptidase [Firmicutes bacterium]|nr:P1 family peptidase [Bacillota bacterium]